MSHNHEQHSEGHFYRGLFYGVILGVGIAYFLRTKEGQKIKNELFSSGERLIDEFSDRVIEFLEEKPTP
jgi:hypothetical protein